MAERWRPRRHGRATAPSKLRLIGYWRGEFEPGRWPDARWFVDRSWPSETRELVADYLRRGRTLKQYRGLSPCRFCGRHNGSKELTDGTYCWPEGLAHYLIQHDVRLPSEFVAHVESSTELPDDRPAPEFDHLGQRVRGAGFDDEYQAAGMAGVRTADGKWWRRQVGWESHTGSDA